MATSAPTAAAFNVRADLYRAVAVACSTDPTRYYLEGVHVEPHPVEGVLLVATDGHRMLVAHDAAGSCSAPAIVRLTGDALKAGKARKSDHGHRFVATNENSVSVVGLQGAPREYECAWKIDGTFPDWRRVVPDPKALKEATPGFNPSYLADFAKARAELLMPEHAIAIRTNGLDGAALISFVECDMIFGVLMPMRVSAERTWMPYFMSPKYKAAAEVAA